MEQLSGKILSDKKTSELFSLPEKIIQFGTGVLLRGLPDYFIDKANRQGIFNGRIVVIKSTEGDGQAFEDQDGLYTISIKGIEDGKIIDEEIVCAAISRVIAARSEWNKILDCAKDKNIQVVISNTTEVGITFVAESIHQHPPESFPAKLLSLLFTRFVHFDGDPTAGLVILPTELLPENGGKLKSILNDLADHNQLDSKFKNWLNNHNRFCNTLVDCIVPGKPADDSLRGGYRDKLAIVSEKYRLWAIEGDEEVKKVLSFYKADSGVKIEPDITKYRELKLRLLNGTHTLSSGAACLAGIGTVREAMDNKIFSSFIRKLMLDEIADAIPYSIDKKEIGQFANSVLDRFKNPAIHHAWLSITLQYTSKMGMRVVPVLLRYYELHKSAPPFIAFGFAAYLRFMKSEKNADGKYQGSIDGRNYLISDPQAGYFSEQWSKLNLEELVKTVLSNQQLWGTDLSNLPGLRQVVQTNIEAIDRDGILKVLESVG